MELAHEIQQRNEKTYHSKDLRNRFKLTGIRGLLNILARHLLILISYLFSGTNTVKLTTFPTSTLCFQKILFKPLIRGLSLSYKTPYSSFSRRRTILFRLWSGLNFGNISPRTEVMSIWPNLISLTLSVF